MNDGQRSEFTFNEIVPRSENMQMALDIIFSTSEKYQEEFLKTIETYRKEIGPFPTSIEKMLLEKGLMKPEIHVFKGDLANNELNRIGFSTGDEKVKDDEILVVYENPKPIRQYWSKYKREIVHDDYQMSETPLQVQNLKGMVIEWGYFYRKLKNVIWKNVYEIGDKTDNAVQVYRCNRIKDHTEDFYYVLLLRED